MFSLITFFLILLCCSAFFSGSETALFSLSGVQIHKLRESHGGAAKRLLDRLKEPRKILVTILLGNELVNVSMSIVGAAVIGRLIEGGTTAQMITATAVLTPIILIFGEILPKNIAIHLAPKLAPLIIWPLNLFYGAVKPVRSLLTSIADKFIKMLGGEPARSEPMIMEDEFRKLIDLGQREGAIVEEEREIIHKVFEFTDKVAGGIMTPEEKVFSLPIDLPYEQILEEIKSVQFSRVPFYSGKKDNIVGILHVRDLFAFHRKRTTNAEGDIKSILHTPVFIESKTPLEMLLKEFQRTGQHMAIVREAGGEVGGIVTMDDILEELFGEIE